MDIVKNVAEYLSAAKAAIDVIKGAASFLPKGSNQEKASQEEIERAEKALKASEGAAAKALGYELCQCTFPPQIMLWKEVDQAHVCPNCSCGRKVAKPGFASPIVVTMPRDSFR